MFNTHKLCHLYPPLSQSNYEELKEDIRIHGQRVNCLVWNGQIIDGAHRYRACRELKIPPNFTDVSLVPEEDLPAMVNSLNSVRRHLSVDQKTMSKELAIANFGPHFGHRALLAAEARDAEENLREGRTNDKDTRRSNKTARGLAEEYGVSENSVFRAKYLLKYAPAEAQHVHAGKQTLSGTYLRVKAQIETVGRPMPVTHNGQSPENELYQNYILEAVKRVTHLRTAVAMAKKHCPEVPNEKSDDKYKALKRAVSELPSLL